MKVVFISHDPLTISTKEIFFLDEYIRDGIEIEYYCVRSIVKYSHSRKLVNEIKPDYYKEITSTAQLKHCLAAQPTDAFFCIELWMNWDSYAIYRMLRQYKDRLFSVDWYINIPRTSPQKKLIDDLKSLHLSKVTDVVIRRIKSRFFTLFAKIAGIGPAPLLFAAGAKSRQLFPGRDTVVLHHHDYSIYRKALAKKEKPEIEGSYAVFLDNMLPFHPDFVRDNNKSVDAVTYFTKLNRLFDKIEQDYALKVIIAAHPKSAYTNEFNGRPVIKYKTNVLVSGASLVVAHQSSSIYFAILNRKPLLLVYTSDFLSGKKENVILKNIYYAVLLYAETLNTGLVNADELDKLTIKPVDDKKYDQFIVDYITEGDPRSNYEIVKSSLSNRMTGNEV